MGEWVTVELDGELLALARRALGGASVRSTVEEALRRLVEQVEYDSAERRRQMDYLHRLDQHLDPCLLSTDEMWR